MTNYHQSTAPLPSKMKSAGDMQTTQHEIVYVVSQEEALALWLSNMEITQQFTKEQAKEHWKKWKQGVANALDFFQVASEIYLLQKIAKDLGSVFGRVYYKKYGGKLHIIFKGRPGLRKILTAPKYGVGNAKVVSLGIGPGGARAAARSGGILSVVLLTGYNVVDYFLTDEMTLMDLVGQLASDIVKVGIVTGASIAGATVLGSVGVVSAFAVGPLVVAVVVGLGVAYVLDLIDDRFKITAKLKDYLNRTADELDQFVKEKKADIRKSVLDLTDRFVRNLIREASEAVKARAKNRFRREVCKITWCEF